MKRLFGLTWVLVCALCLLSVKTAYAQLNSASINGETEVFADRAYTYILTVDAQGPFDVITKCGGAFEILKNPELASTSGGMKSVEIQVKVKKNAQPGDTGTITMIGSGNVLDQNGDIADRFDINKIFTAIVIAPTPGPISPPAPEAPPSPTSAPRKEQKLSPAPSALPNEQTDGQALTERIDSLGDGETATFSATQSSSVSYQALSAIKQRQSIITLDFGTYSCTIDGALLGALPDDMPPLDLSMSMIKDASLSEAANGRDIYQLHFAHSGALPGVFGFGFPAAAHQPGDTLYLYYYYGTSGIIEYKNSAVVDENGWVTFDIYHCSSYFVTDVPLDDLAAAPSSPRQGSDTEVNADESTPPAHASTASQTPPAVTLPVLIGALLIAAGVSIFVTLKVSSRSKK